MSDILDSVQELADTTSKFQSVVFDRIDDVEKSVAEITDRVEEREAKDKAPPMGGKLAPEKRAPDGYNLKTQKPVYAIKAAEPLSLFGFKENKTGVTLGDWLQVIALGDKAGELYEKVMDTKDLATSPDSAGGYTVPAPLAGEFIDLLRSKMVLNEAGARLIPMDSKTLDFAKLLTDPVSTFKAENAPVSESDPTFGQVQLVAKTVTARVDSSWELWQDSINVSEMLTNALAQSMALAIDQAGLNGQVGGEDPTGVENFANVLSLVDAAWDYDTLLDAHALLMGQNVSQDDIGNTVTTVTDAIAFQKIKDSTGQYVVPPPTLDPASIIGTTSSSTDVAITGKWDDLFWGLREGISIRFFDQVAMPDRLGVQLLAWARVDFAGAREQSFVKVTKV